MSWKVTAAFVLAAALLGAIVVGLERFNVGQPSAKPTEKDEQMVIFQFDDRKVTAFEGRAGERSQRFTKSGDSWTLDGSGEPANRLTISSLLIRMSQLRGTRRLEGSGPDLKTYGLAEPRLQVTAEMDDGTVHTLLLGDRTPVGSGVYAKKADASEVFVVATQMGTDLERLLNDPREPPTPTPRPTSTPTPPTTPTPTSTPTS